MKVRELLEKLEQLKKDNPTRNINEYEIASRHKDDLVLLSSSVFIVDQGFSNIHINGHKCIGFGWQIDESNKDK